LNKKTLTSSLILLLAALIWGFAFVAQRVGMDYIGPFAFNGIRFALGALSLIPVIIILNKKNSEKSNIEDAKKELKPTLLAGITLGIILFIGASLQQIGLVSTSAGKTAFITCLYIVLVPIIGIFLKHKIQATAWLGAMTATVGLYFLCITENFTIASGDVILLIGSFFWAVHILAIDHFSQKIDALKLALFQFITCSVLSIITALFVETVNIHLLFNIHSMIAILYCGILSVGVAFTLQIVGQKNAPPSYAAILLSMENVFGVIGGWLILHETLGLKGIIGCSLMFSGIIISQIPIRKKDHTLIENSD
jgi:drug/metabolite transporter (DMT)-like permease